MQFFRAGQRAFAVALVVGGGSILFAASNLFGNHPVLLEGNCVRPPVGNPGPVVPGTCGDYDGDGLIGAAEDNDGDRVFGTLTRALANATGANQNGAVTIVTSGIFAEVTTITGANGNVTLQAAPGVEAIIDAVLQGDPGNAARQNAPGIIVNAPDDRYVVIRNVTVRNWTTGILVRGTSHVAIESVRLENNTNHGVAVGDEARVTIAKSEVHATGRRVSAIGDFPRVNDPMPGSGIHFADASVGTVFFTTVSGSFRAGIEAVDGARVCISHVNVFDNNPNFRGVPRGGDEDSNNRCDRDRT